MKVKDLLDHLREVDPEMNVTLAISDAPSLDSRLRYIHVQHPTTRYKHDDGTYQTLPPLGSPYDTGVENSIILTNWFMSSSFDK